MILDSLFFGLNGNGVLEYWITSGSTKIYWILWRIGSGLVGKKCAGTLFYGLVNMGGLVLRAGLTKRVGRKDVLADHITHGIDKYHHRHSASQYLLITTFSDITRYSYAWHRANMLPRNDLSSS